LGGSPSSRESMISFGLWKNGNFTYLQLQVRMVSSLDSSPLLERSKLHSCGPFGTKPSQSMSGEFKLPLPLSPNNVLYACLTYWWISQTQSVGPYPS
jgi:hypothetical protein